MVVSLPQWMLTAAALSLKSSVTGQSLGLSIRPAVALVLKCLVPEDQAAAVVRRPVRSWRLAAWLGGLTEAGMTYASWTDFAFEIAAWLYLVREPVAGLGLRPAEAQRPKVEWALPCFSV